MARCRKQEPNCRHSIKYKWDDIEGSSFELTDYVDKCRKPGDDSSTMLSTSQLVSVFGHVLDRASRITLKKGLLSKGEMVEFSVDSTSVKPKLEFLKVTQKLNAFRGCSDSLAWMVLRGLGRKLVLAGDISGDTTIDKENFVAETHRFTSSLIDGKPIYDRTAITSLRSDYSLDSVEDRTEGNVSQECKSGICADYFISCKALRDVECVEFEYEGRIKLAEERRERREDFLSEDDNRIKSCLPANGSSQFSLAKQEHAFAGALSGVFVSLCLHPVDTVKTVVQSCRAEQKSLSYIGRSIVSDRGFIGLYGGIASNIASSAPISAVYTFTYESVKGALLPLFPKECSSFAHCVAGGCASIATSFIFTPSERIKQQMQVGSRYRNSWDAFFGILGKGGLPSLYAGWGAVLCRNVPHSIIKFYMYENLKQLMSPSLELNAQPGTLQTLFCGGFAGSTAALFTTPFDVVKTRLQTQIPGSVNQYDNVFHALKEISRREGLNGLYRGLIPRLVMYMSQGALFFASYEFFKRLISLKVATVTAPRFQYKEMTEDDSIS